MKKNIFILFFLLTHVTYGQIINGGFETWDTTYAACYDSDLTSLYGVTDPYGGFANNWATYYSTCGVARTTDSYAENYSLLLYNWYKYDYGKISYTDSINYRPQYLQGYFKYITGGETGLSHGTATIYLTKFNGTSNDTLATGTHQFDSTTSYTPFQITLNYTSTLTPDSIHIYMLNGNDECRGVYFACNLLYLDNVTLSNTPLSIDALIPSVAHISVSPNPFSEQTTLHTDNILNDATLTVYNSFGQCVKQINTISQQKITLQRDKLPSGSYFIQLTQNDKILAINKLIITP